MASLTKTGVSVQTQAKIDQVAAALETYASRGVFRGFSRAATTATRGTFKILWHRDRTFDLIFDARKNTFRFASVLPDVPPEMFSDLQEFIAIRQSGETIEHRRNDPEKLRIEIANRTGEVELTMTMLDSDLDYAVRKLIHLVHEIYLVFLHDGKYYDYLITTFNLDPDYIQFT